MQQGGGSVRDKVRGAPSPKEYIAPWAGSPGGHPGRRAGGYPMVDIEVELFDGSYHEVDSNEMAFKIAGSIGFKEAPRGGSILLEPIMAPR